MPKGKPMGYKKPKRIFEDAGLVDPRSAYHVELEGVVNTKNQDMKTIVDRGRYFSLMNLTAFPEMNWKIF